MSRLAQAADPKGRQSCTHLRELHTVRPSTSLTQALQLLLDAGVSALPVVNEVSYKSRECPHASWGGVHLAGGCKGSKDSLQLIIDL